MRFFTLHLFCFLALLGLSFSSCSKRRNAAALQDFSRRFFAFEKFESDVFDKLVFRASPRVLNSNTTLKFLVSDQLGRDWLFKAAQPGAPDGIIAVHRIHNLFGMDDPEAHYKTFLVNGRSLDGTVERFIPNIGGLTEEIFPRLKPDSVEYLARSHAIDWLLSNDAVHAGQFLVTSKDGVSPTGILRIDNAINWRVMATDKIDIDYQTPMLFPMSGLGYLTFWRHYLWGTFDVPFKKLLLWARFVSEFPETEFLGFFERGISNDYLFFPNNGMSDLEAYRRAPEIMLRKPDKTKFTSLLLQKKRDLARSLRAVYASLTSMRGVRLEPDGDWRAELVAQELTARLAHKEGLLKSDAVALAAAPAAAQEPLLLPISIDAYEILRNLVVMEAGSSEKDDNLADALLKLKALAGGKTLAIEREPIQNAIKNLVTLRELKALRFRRQEFGQKQYWELLIHTNKFFERDWKDLQQMVAKTRSARGTEKN